MIIELSDFYKKKGFKSSYLITNSENRKMVCLVGENEERKTISYAKYLYTSHYNVEVDEGIHIDHINGDKTDDRIENLQAISGTYNRKKDHVVKSMLIRTCPVCGTEFLFEERNLSTHPNPCCSRRCGGIKSHWGVQKSKATVVGIIDKNEVVEMFKTMTQKQIADHFNISVSSVKRILKS